MRLALDLQGDIHLLPPAQSERPQEDPSSPLVQWMGMRGSLRPEPEDSESSYE